MSQKEINEHAKIIADHVFHSFPYNQFKPNFKGPHAEDCEGCIVNAEVEKLVDKLNLLSPVEEILAELEKEREKRKTLTEDRWNAFDNAGVPKEGSIADLVATLIAERDRLIRLLEDIDNDLWIIRNKIKVNPASEPVTLEPSDYGEPGL